MWWWRQECGAPTATLEPAAARTATIGSEGGTITATSAAGILYTLEVPAGAVISPQQIRMTPITDIQNLGLSGGLAGAVDLQPAGLTFAVPARLRIRTSQSTPAGTRLVGFSANNDFSRRELSLVGRATGEVVIVVSHFAGNADVCGNQASLAALRNVYYWHAAAHDLGVDDASHGLDASSVVGQVRTKCAVVVLANSNLPDSLPAGQNFNLALDFALRFRNGQERPTDFRIDLTGAGVNITNPGGFTGIGDAISPLGFYTTVINPTAAGGFRLRAKSCFVPLRAAAAPSTLCDPFELTKVIYFNDFQQPVGSEWTIPATSVTPSGRKFLGEMTAVTNTLTVDSIPLHTHLILEFDLYIIGSWNGNAALPGTGTPDVIEFAVQGGGGVLKRTTFSNKPRDAQAFPGDFPGSSFGFGSGAAERSSLGYPVGPDFISDAVYQLTLEFPHTAASVKLLFNGTTDGAIERWGLDNVRVKFRQ